MVGPIGVPRVSPKWAPCGPLANSAWAPREPPISCPRGHPHGAHLWPVWIARVGPDESMDGPRWVPRVLSEWAPCGPLANSAWAPRAPPISYPTGHPHGAHLWPVWTVRVGPRWVHAGAQMGPMCIAQMGPLWPPGQFCLGPVWAARMGPSGPPTWGQHGAQIVLLAGSWLGALANREKTVAR